MFADETLLAAFWEMPFAERSEKLLQAVFEAHQQHYACNRAYRQTVAGRGIGPTTDRADLPALLRPTAQTFKSYIDILGTPFPQDCPLPFLDWLADQLSIDLPRDRFAQFRHHYASLENLLSDIERIYADFGLEISTSSGTSGRSTIMLRDQDGIKRTVDSFYLSFQRYFGLRVDHRAIFIMPRDTRIAMARMASFSVRRLGLPEEHIHYTIPFPAHPDQVRIRAGRTFRPGLAGSIERRAWHPFMNWANDQFVMPRSIRLTLALVEQAAANGEKVLLFSGWIQLHQLARLLLKQGRQLHLAPGSLVGSGGGIKELYPYPLEQIQRDLASVIDCDGGKPIPVRDVYGMAESNWAAMQCECGNYHIPPWVLAVALDADDRFQETPRAVGRLAFFDPLGGGNLFPAFFRTADQVQLVNGLGAYDPADICPCGEDGAYIARDSIQRVDLMDEAGCAAQV